MPWRHYLLATLPLQIPHKVNDPFCNSAIFLSSFSILILRKSFKVSGFKTFTYNFCVPVSRLLSIFEVVQGVLTSEPYFVSVWIFMLLVFPVATASYDVCVPRDFDLMFFNWFLSSLSFCSSCEVNLCFREILIFVFVFALCTFLIISFISVRESADSEDKRRDIVFDHQRRQ